VYLFLSSIEMGVACARAWSSDVGSCGLAASLSVLRRHFTVAPHSGKAGDEATQLRGRLSRFGVGDTDFKLRQRALRFSNFTQQSNRVQRRQRLPELFLALL